MCFGDCRYRVKINHVQSRIADCLDENGSRLVADSFLKVLGIFRVDEFDRDAKLRQDRIELNIGSAVQVVGGDDFVPLGADVDNRVENSRGSRSQCQCCRSSLELGDSLFKDILGRVAYPGIDIAEFLEREKIGRMFRTFKDVRAGSINRYGAG